MEYLHVTALRHAPPLNNDGPLAAESQSSQGVSTAWWTAGSGSVLMQGRTCKSRLPCGRMDQICSCPEGRHDLVAARQGAAHRDVGPLLFLH